MTTRPGPGATPRQQEKLTPRAEVFYRALTGVSPAGPSTSGSRRERESPVQGKGGTPPDRGEDRFSDRPSPRDGERLACVDIPALPLQLLVQRHPEWSDRPVAVVAEDRPQGVILWVNERAYRARVLPGMRYAAGLSLCRDLCAGELAEADIDTGIARITDRLRDFSPFVESSGSEPGVFWMDATGLCPLESSLQEWAERVRTNLSEAGFVARVALGSSRFVAYALARSCAGVTVLDTPEREREVAARIRLDRMHLEPKLRDRLSRLGIRTIGDLVTLPTDELARRFGTEALRLHRMASGDLREPLVPELPRPATEAWIELEHPLADSTRLVFVIKSVLGALLSRLAERGQGLVELTLDLTLDDREHDSATIRTADATLEELHILDLVRLKLETMELSAGITELRVEARGREIDRQQLDLFVEQPRRDLAAASRAFVRLRTEFGRLAVVWARLRRAHLPEAGFTWESVENARFPAPRSVPRRTLVRRLYDTPVPLPHRGHHEPDGWLVRGPEQGPMVRIHGPFVVAGGWWVREVRRDYHYVETQKGDVMWVFYDRRRRRWFLQGQLE